MPTKRGSIIVFPWLWRFTAWKNAKRTKIDINLYMRTISSFSEPRFNMVLPFYLLLLHFYYFVFYFFLFYFQLVLTHTENFYSSRFSSSFWFVFLRGFSEIGYLFTKFSIKNTSQQKWILYMYVCVHREGCFFSDFVAFVFYSLILQIFIFIELGFRPSIPSVAKKKKKKVIQQYIVDSWRFFNLFFFVRFSFQKQQYISYDWMHPLAFHHEDKSIRWKRNRMWGEIKAKIIQQCPKDFQYLPTHMY